MNHLTRRQIMQAFGFGALGLGATGWRGALAQGLAQQADRRRHCILLWMNGGPSQIDTFDLKPGHENGGEFKEIPTSVPGIKISEHLPKLAQWMDHLAIVRSLSTKEGDHGRGTYLMRTGHVPAGTVQYPALGASLAKALGDPVDSLPSYVSIAPFPEVNQQAFGSGFLGPAWSPLTVGSRGSVPLAEGNSPQAPPRFAPLTVDDLKEMGSDDKKHLAGRGEIWNQMQDEFLRRHGTGAPRAHDTLYRRAFQLMHSDAIGAFDLTQEPDKIREAYGAGRFGQGCLLARRLIEHGVPFVEVTLGNPADGTVGWDTHADNFKSVKALSGELDAGWATLLTELRERGLLESTTILWMGEFGRTPKINAMGGRDHFPNAWSCVLGGGGIRGGQVYGSTSPDGGEVAEKQIGVEDLLATLCSALGVDPEMENAAEDGRPIKIVEGSPVPDLVA